MRISDWSSDVCSSDLAEEGRGPDDKVGELAGLDRADLMPHALRDCRVDRIFGDVAPRAQIVVVAALAGKRAALHLHLVRGLPGAGDHLADPAHRLRSEEHTSELQSLMRISYAVFCLKKKKTHTINTHTRDNDTK